MKIRLLCQAALEIKTKSKTIVTDPWFEGEIYGNAWELCPPPINLPDWDKVDALYISHHHSDHYHSITLRKIYRANPDIVVFLPKFFHTTIKKAIEKIGFKVVELPTNKTYNFDGLELYCIQFRMNDTVFVVNDGKEILIDLNDCLIRGRTLDEVVKRYPTPTYVFSQFSIAQAYPYCYDTKNPDFTSQVLVDVVDNYYDRFKPKYMIPFAGLMRFCNKMNQHMNGNKLTLLDLPSRSKRPLTYLFPGDEIIDGELKKDKSNFIRYKKALESRKAIVDEIVPKEIIEKSISKFFHRLKNAPVKLRKKAPQAYIVMDDINSVILFDMASLKYSFMKGKQYKYSSLWYETNSKTFNNALIGKSGWEDFSLSCKFRAHVDDNMRSTEYYFWIVPIAMAGGYFKCMNDCLKLHQRPLRVAWGRRLELKEYAIKLLDGTYTSDVLRKKTDYK